MHNNALDDRLLTVKEAARYLGFKVGTVYNKVSGGSIPHVKLGASVRFRKSELDDWISERDAEARSRSEKGAAA